MTLFSWNFLALSRGYLLDMRIAWAKKAVFIFTLIVFWAPCVFAQSANSSGNNSAIIQEIEVTGLQRIEETTLRSYLTVSAGDDFSKSRLNQSLKNLYATGLFSDISFRRDGRTLVVAVKENPIINQIAFEGNQRIDDERLRQEVQLRPRVVYTKSKIQDDIERILTVYRRQGRFSARVEPKIIRLDQNRVNLVFEISEGPETKIQQITFIGNTSFDDEELQDVIRSQPERWYRFLNPSDTYDPDQVSFDEELLRRFYLSQGYPEFQVKSAVAELSPDQNGFFLTFVVDEGPRYNFGKIDIQSELDDLEKDSLRQVIDLETGQTYDASTVEDTVLDLTDAIEAQKFLFFDVNPSINLNRDEKRVYVTFQVEKAPKVFVERINISGNVRTIDRVIRREIELAEGDPFNKDKVAESEQNIRDLDYFSEVNLNVRRGENPNTVTMDVEVVEKSTGELSIGAGFSTVDGPLADLRIRERNLLGRGQDLLFATTISGETQEFDISFTEPYFLNRDIAAGVDLFRVTRDFQDESSFDQRRTGFNLRTGYPLGKNLRQQLNYNLEENIIEDVDPTASLFIREQEGERITSLIGQTLTYDSRDSRINPTEGWLASLATDVAGLGGDAQFVRGRLTGKTYYTIADDWVISFLGEGGIVQGWSDENVAINDRFFIGGSTLRGFDNAGIGPRDLATDDALGGNRFVRGSAELTFPIPFTEDLGLKGHAFSDAGTLWEVDSSGSGIEDEASLRLSAGVGISWRSPLGPVRVDVAQPLIKEDFDEEEVFRFSFGTRF
jgi:outer membrane protein insertion porin family